MGACILEPTKTGERQPDKSDIKGPRAQRVSVVDRQIAMPVIPRMVAKSISATLNPWEAIVGGYLQGTRIMSGLLCRILSIHSGSPCVHQVTKHLGSGDLLYRSMRSSPISQPL